MAECAGSSPPPPPAPLLEPEKDFILTFETLPQLWDTANPHYTNKYSRNKALEKLLPILQRMKPMATIEDVKKKINTIKSNYRRELRKIIASQRSGAGPDDVYCPRVWSFPYLHFLRRLESPGRLCQDDAIGLPQETNNQQHEEIHLKPFSLPSNLKMKRKAIKKESSNSTFEYLSQQRCQSTPERIAQPIVLEWTDTLERLDPVQRLYAKKAINDILFEAELGNLHKHSVKINEPNIYYSPRSNSGSLTSPPYPSPSHLCQMETTVLEDSAPTDDSKLNIPSPSHPTSVTSPTPP